MAIEWNRVTWYSKIAAAVLFVGVFIFGIWVGMVYQFSKDQNFLLESGIVIDSKR